jgi:hypothetical protein
MLTDKLPSRFEFRNKCSKIRIVARISPNTTFGPWMVFTSEPDPSIIAAGVGTAAVVRAVLLLDVMGIPSQDEFPQGPEIESIASRLGDTGQ